MPSKFELYKQTLDEQTSSDFEELQKLYQRHPEYYNNYGFADFVNYATADSDSELDDQVKAVLAGPKLPEKAKDNPDYYRELFDKARDKEILESDKPFPEWRRVYANVFDELATGSAQLLRDAVSTAFLGSDPNISSKFLPSDQQIQDGVNSVLRNQLTGDIYDRVVDEEGNVSFKLQEPKTLIGSGTATLGSVIAATVGAKKGLINPAKTLYKNIKGVPAVAAKKRGRPSKAELAQREQLLKRQKLLKAGETLAAAEIGAQVVFADDPEVLMVAGTISNFVGNDDNFVADIFQYLDADEDSTALQRRLSLLLDGLAFTGVLAGGVKVLKGGKDTFMKTLDKVKQEGPEAVAKFKKLINYNRSGDSAVKTSAKVTKNIQEKSINDVWW
jgi:hypothetical protein